MKLPLLAPCRAELDNNSINRIILAGGSGFLGRLLASHFLKAGWEVVNLTRQALPTPKGWREIVWDGVTIGPWQRELEGATAVLNLCGKSVNCRYSAQNRREILASRVESTQALGRALAICTHPPGVWLNASTATIYKHSFAIACDEHGQIDGARVHE